MVENDTNITKPFLKWEWCRGNKGIYFHLFFDNFIFVFS